MSNEELRVNIFGEDVDQMPPDRLREVVKILAKLLDETMQSNLENHRFYSELLRRRREGTLV